MKRFQNKVALVTGASRGIGQAIACALHDQGARLITLGLHPTNLPNALFFPTNFETLSQSSAQDLIHQILSQTQTIDILVNNAGIIRRSPAIDYSQDDWQTVLQVNLNAPFYLSQALAKWWISTQASVKRETRLKIINIASMLSFQGGIRVPAYTAAKSALAGLTRALACEWAFQNINVNAIAPGYIETENTRPLREDPARNQSILDRIPQNRWGAPPDISGAALFLASPDADYINGAILNVDGGWLAR